MKALEVTTLNIDFQILRGSLLNSGWYGGVRPKFKLIQALMVVTCKNEKDNSKMEVIEWPQHLSHGKSMGIFPDAKGQITPQS